MKIVAISDLHSKWNEIKVPECDILINAGDITYAGEVELYKGFNSWMKKQPAKHKISIAGNHDVTLDWSSDCLQPFFHQRPPYFLFSKDERKQYAEKMINLFEDFNYLEEQETIIKGIKIFGTPWNKEFMNWGFNASEKELEEKYSRIPNDTQILVCHEPPYGLGDHNGTDHCGSLSLLDRIKQVKPEIVICGHIHEGYGMYKVGSSLIINAACLDRAYNAKNKPIEINI